MPEKNQDIETQADTESEEVEGNITANSVDSTYVPEPSPDEDADFVDSTTTQNTQSIEFTSENILENPEVRRAIESARTQEKNKLYGTLESRNEEIAGLKKKVTQLSEQLSEKENENLSEVEILQKQIGELKEEQANLVAEFESEREAAKRQQRQAELGAYKERRLREEGDELVSALVGGDSEEAIDSSIEVAKKEYQTIVEKAREEESANRRTNVSRVTNPPSSSEGPVLTREQIRNMSSEEYAKNREAILRAALQGNIEE